MKDNGRAGQNEQRDAFMDSRPIKASPNYTLDTNPIKLDAAQLCALPFLLADFPSSISLPPPAAARSEAAAMQAAAARARRVLVSPAASGLPGILWGPRLESASSAEGALLLHLYGVPSSASSRHHARDFSSCFAPQSPGELSYHESLNCIVLLL